MVGGSQVFEEESLNLALLFFRYTCQEDSLALSMIQLVLATWAMLHSAELIHHVFTVVKIRLAKKRACKEVCSMLELPLLLVMVSKVELVELKNHAELLLSLFVILGPLLGG
mmetsp:Transcript_10738/g.18025  ORF Transcript_10738/g.18025 Transcript_10738/m.18025 type:complete len:112 (-) Transcript_10738:150-485(-)